MVVMAFALLGGCANFDNDQPPALPAADTSASLLFNDENVILLLDSAQASDDLIVNVSRRGYQLIERRRLEGLGLILLDFRRPPNVSDEVALNDMSRMGPSATVGLDTLYKEQARQGTPAKSSKSYANALMGWPADGCKAHTPIGLIDGYLSPQAQGFPADRIISKSFTQSEPGASEHAETVASLVMDTSRISGAKLYAAAVIGSSPSGKRGSGTKEIIFALDWMQSEGVRLVNISLSGPFNPLLERAVSKATDLGMTIVAAVGNDGPDAPPQYPAAFAPVIGVTAVDVEKNIFVDSVRGPHVDYAAPGVEIFIESGQQSGRYVSGTSLAAPHVTALIAVDTSRSFAGGHRSVMEFLDQNIHDLGAQGRDSTFGMGLVQAGHACSQ